MQNQRRNKRSNQTNQAENGTKNNRNPYDSVLGILGIALLIVAILLLYNGWRWLFDDSAIANKGGSPAALVDPTERIQTSGKMIVGTAANRPPFAYYDENFQLTGFDIALMGEIGQELGLEIEFRDIAFDGLATAVANDHIDLAIAAIPITPQHDTVFDFTLPYYISEDAILARADLDLVQLTTIEEMSPYRIGVQNGSPFHQWVQTSLIDTDLMPTSNLFRYQQTDQATYDLNNGQIDLVIANIPAAERALATTNVKLVGHALNQQQYGIGIKNGAVNLQTELNQALNSLQANGRIAQLAQLYLGVAEDELIPIPLPLSDETAVAPAPTAAPPACTNNLRIVSHLNLDDNGMQTPPQLAAGQPFRKGWRIENTGSCNWDNTFNLVYNGRSHTAERMSSNPTPIEGIVPPGETYDIYLDLIAPFQPGRYQAFWTLQTPDGQSFGERLPLSGDVVAPPMPTPAPQTAVTDFVFMVDRDNIQSGDCVTFNWDIPTGQTVYFYPQGSDWTPHQVVSRGAQVECPPVTTTYELRLSDKDEAPIIHPTTIYVTTAVDRPSIDRFTVNPAVIALNQCVDIHWQVSEEASAVRIYYGGALLYDNAPLSGRHQDCPTEPGTIVYAVEAIGANGNSSYQQRNVIIISNIDAIPLPPTPIINVFTVNPAQITAGACIVVHWDVSHRAEYVRLSKNGQPVLDGGTLYASVPDCLDNAGSYTYRLEAVGRNNQITAEERLIIVTD